MKEWEKVINHIPKGKKNAISRAQLSVLTGLPDRTNRQAIEDARRSGVMIISGSNTKGYYITDDYTEWKMFLEEHRRRALSELALYNEGIKLLPIDSVTSKIIPVRAHIRHIKKDMPCDGQIELEAIENE